MAEDRSMITTVTQKNMVTIPAEVGRKLGIKPGWKLDWQPVEGRDEILVRVIPDRGERARRLLGASRKLSPDRDAVAELVAERKAEGWEATEQQRLAELESRGLVTLPQRTERGFEGRAFPHRGKLASEMVNEDRR